VHHHWDRLTSYDDPLAWTRRVLANSATSRGRRMTTDAKLRVRRRERRTPDLELPEPDREMWDLVRALPRRPDRHRRRHRCLGSNARAGQRGS
ncbi:MAG: hypothetical protein WA964_01155, partial [Ilumatobacter sp.]